ncbi:MaoC family dehydratase N-terminal domain-containing protein [Virgibacillus kimchii]
MYKNMIGKKSDKVKNAVERTLVRRFAEAIGDPHPIFIDEETGKQSRYGANIAPPTFPRTFDFGTVEGLQLPEKGLIHGGQNYYYERPLLVGEEVYCFTRVKDYFEKEGKNGLMSFLVIERFGESTDGDVIFTEASTVIINEKVREAMQA